MNVISYYMPPHVIMCETQNNLFQLISNFGFIELDNGKRGHQSCFNLVYIEGLGCFHKRENCIIWTVNSTDWFVM